MTDQEFKRIMILEIQEKIRANTAKWEEDRAKYRSNTLSHPKYIKAHAVFEGAEAAYLDVLQMLTKDTKKNLLKMFSCNELYQIAQDLDTTIADLLGKPVRVAVQKKEATK